MHPKNVSWKRNRYGPELPSFEAWGQAGAWGVLCARWADTGEEPSAVLGAAAPAGPGTVGQRVVGVSMGGASGADGVVEDGKVFAMTSETVKGEVSSDFGGPNQRRLFSATIG